MNRIFVYGSLMQSFFNYNKYLKDVAIKIEPAYVVGTLYHLENKGYPGYVESGNDLVLGEIITFKEDVDILKMLDQLEGCVENFKSENPYNRKSILVMRGEDEEKLELDAYIYNLESKENQEDKRIYIGHGSWRKYMLETNHKNRMIV